MADSKTEEKKCEETWNILCQEVGKCSKKNYEDTLKNIEDSVKGFSISQIWKKLSIKIKKSYYWIIRHWIKKKPTSPYWYTFLKVSCKGRSCTVECQVFKWNYSVRKSPFCNHQNNMTQVRIINGCWNHWVNVCGGTGYSCRHKVSPTDYSLIMRGK